MNTVRPLLLAAACLLLAGCLEVDQHPPYRHDEYAGKPDNLPQQRLFHGDRMAWMAAITDRNWLQDEYRRTQNHGASYD